MLRWLGATGSGSGANNHYHQHQDTHCHHHHHHAQEAATRRRPPESPGAMLTTDDPLAALGPLQAPPGTAGRRSAACSCSAGAKEIYSVSRVNPMFVDAEYNNLAAAALLAKRPPQPKHPPPPPPPPPLPPAAAAPAQQDSSGYGSHGGSSHEPTYLDSVRLREDAITVLEQHAGFVRHILVAAAAHRKSVGSLGSSAAGTLTTIPEGRVDTRIIPRPIWPDDSALPQSVAPCSEEDVRRFCLSLSNSERLSAVVRAFSHNHPHNVYASSSETDQDLYNASSSSGFSEVNPAAAALPVFVHEDLAALPNGLRNAMIYGTLLRGKAGAGTERLLGKDRKCPQVKSNKKPAGGGLLAAAAAASDGKPSVWEMYYGAGLGHGDVRFAAKPTDPPYYPGGRPETDFTLDVPRSELLTRKMAAAKRRRCRCRLFTSLLGLLFFLLSLMAVSLMLTRGKRMFGSMV